MNGNTSFSGGGCFQLTSAQTNQAASLWQLSEVDLTQPFDIQFEVNFGNLDPGGDGVVFVLQREGVNALGNGGSGMGYKDLSPSLGIEFDTRQDLLQGDPASDHTAIHKNGGVFHYGSTNIAGPIQASPFTTNIEDGAFHLIRIVWNPSTPSLQVYFDTHLRLTLNQNIITSVFAGATTAYWGITAATSSVANVQQVCLIQNPVSTVSSTVDLCYGDTLNLVLPNGSNFAWNPTTGLLAPNLQSQFIFPLTNTNYTVTYQDTAGNPASTSIQVNVNPLPLPYSVVIPVGDSSYCKGGPGVDIGMNNSQSSVLYDLYLDGNLLWSDVSGNGSGFSFGLQQYSGTYTAIGTDSLTGCSAPMTGSITVVIDSLPIKYNVTGGGFYCQNGPGRLVGLDGSEAGLQYVLFRNGSINMADTVIGTGGPISFPLQQMAGAYSVFAINPVTGCTAWMTGNVTVSIWSLPPVSLLSPPDLCSGDNPIELNYGTPTGGTYTGFGVIGDSLINTTTPGTRMLIYSYQDPATGCINSDSMSYQVFALPSPDLGPDTSFCDGDNLQLSLTFGYAAYLWQDASISSTYTLNSPGTYSVTVTDGNGCNNADSIQVSMDALPLVQLSPFTDMCIDNTPLTLSGGTPAGGIYFGTGVSVGSFDPSVSGTGTFNINYQYTDPSTGCTSSDQSAITVNPLPAVFFSPLNDLCVSDPPINLISGTPAGGVYSGSGVSGGAFDPSIGAGTYPILYTYTDPSTSCVNDTQQSITVNPLPILSVPSLSPICEVILSKTLPAGAPAGGTWTGPGVSGYTFSPVNGAATYDLWYHYQEPVTQCQDSIQAYQVVHPLPVVDLNLPQTACEGGAPIPLSGGSPAGGTYSGPLVSGGQFVPLFAGLYPITYTYTNPATQCTSSAIDSFRVYALPVINFPPLPDACISDTAIQLNSATPAGGLYSGPGVNAGWFDPAVAGQGTHSIKYSYIDPISGCEDSAFSDVTVYALPVVTHTAIADICINDLPLTLSGGSPAGGIYYGSGVTANSFDPVTHGLYNLTYVFSAGTGCTDSTLVSVHVNPLPSLSITTPADLCENAPDLVLNNAIPIGGTYTGSGIIGNVFDPSIGAGTLPYTYTYQDPSTSCIDSITDTITVLPLPNVSLNLPGPFCASDPDTLLDGGLPLGGIYGGSGLSNDTFQPAQGPGGFSIYYYFEDNLTGCRDTAFGTITVYPLPSLTMGTLPDLCLNDPLLNLNMTTPPGGIWSGPGVSGTNFDPAAAGSGIHTLTYTYQDPAFSCVDSIYDSLEVFPLPTVDLLLDTAVCQGSPALALSGGSPAGGTYGGIGVSGAVFTNTAISGDHPVWYAYSDPASGCTDTAHDTLTVHPLPQLSITPAPDFCAGDPPYTLSGATPSGGWWTGPGLSSGTFDPAIGSGSWMLVYHYQDALTQCADSITDTIVVHSLPSLSMPVLPDFCDGDSLYPLAGASPAGGTWGGSGISGNNFDPGSGPGQYPLWYAYQDPGSLCSDTVYDTVTVHALPQVSFTAPGPFCENEPMIVVLGGSPSGGTYDSPYMVGSNFDPGIGYGSYPVYYHYLDLTTGCLNTATDSIHVDSLPVVQAPLIPDLCMDTLPMALQDGVPAGGWWSGNEVINGDFVPAGPGNYDLWYAYQDSQSGCADSALINVDVWANPDPWLPSDTAFCAGGSITLDMSHGYLYWNWSDGSNFPVLNVSTAGTWWVQVEDVHGCLSVPDTVNVSVYPAPEPRLPEDTSICRNETLMLSAAPGFLSYFWSNGEQTSAVSLTSQGWHWVEVTDQHYCQGRDSIFLLVLPLPVISLPDSVYLCSEDYVELDVSQAYEQASYLWNDGVELPVRYIYDPGTYAVFVDNGACSNSDSVRVLPCARIWAANAFTPNGDGLNDLFHIISSEPLYRVNFTIHDRWGQVVYQSSSIDMGWDGSYNGQPCPEDAYTWVLRYEREAPVGLEREGRMVGKLILLR